MSELLEMRKKQLTTSIKLLWAFLLCTIVVNIFLDIHFAYTILPIGFALALLSTFLVFSKKIYTYLEYIIIFSVYLFLFITISYEPLLFNFIFIWFTFAFSSFFQNLGLIIFSSLITVGFTIYFFFNYRNEIFYGLDTFDITYLLVFNAFLTTFFLINHQLKSKWEQKLLLQRKVIRESETRYRTLIEQSPDPIIVYRKNMIVYANKAAVKRVGLYSMDGLIGRNIFDFLHPDSHKEVKKLISTIQLEKESEFIEAKFQGKNGEIFFGELSTAVIIYNDSKAFQVVIRDITERKHTEQQLKIMNEKLMELSNTDSLTGISNRRYFENQSQIEWKRAIRNFRPVSVLMIDIDYFKQFNDSYGHQAGDVALKKVASALEECLMRSTDILGRYGGEEFILALPETDNYGAFQVAKRIQERIAELKIPHETSLTSNYLTVSIGVATKTPTIHCTLDTLIHSADDALYRSKQQGRNKIYVSKECIS